MESGITQTNHAAPSLWRAGWFLVRLSFLRQARAHLMVWVALGLLALTLFIVGLSTQMGMYNRAYDRYPDERGRFYVQHLNDLTQATTLPWQPPAPRQQPQAHGTGAEQQLAARDGRRHLYPGPTRAVGYRRQSTPR